MVAADPWPRREVLALARRAYECGAREGQFYRPVLTIIDYSLPASEPRLWVIDMERERVVHHSFQEDMYNRIETDRVIEEWTGATGGQYK